MRALMVTIKIKAGHRDAFMEALLSDARGSVHDEPGCLRFDVLQDARDANTLYLYEVYRDEAAIEAHRQAPHFVKRCKIGLTATPSCINVAQYSPVRVPGRP